MGVSPLASCVLRLASCVLGPAPGLSRARAPGFLLRAYLKRKGRAFPWRHPRIFDLLQPGGLLISFCLGVTVKYLYRVQTLSPPPRKVTGVRGLEMGEGFSILPHLFAVPGLPPALSAVRLIPPFRKVHIVPNVSIH